MQNCAELSVFRRCAELLLIRGEKEGLYILRSLRNKDSCCNNVKYRSRNDGNPLSADQGRAVCASGCLAVEQGRAVCSTLCLTAEKSRAFCSALCLTAEQERGVCAPSCRQRRREVSVHRRAGRAEKKCLCTVVPHRGAGKRCLCTVVAAPQRVHCAPSLPHRREYTPRRERPD